MVPAAAVVFLLTTGWTAREVAGQPTTDSSRSTAMPQQPADEGPYDVIVVFESPAEFAEGSGRSVLDMAAVRRSFVQEFGSEKQRAGRSGEERGEAVIGDFSAVAVGSGGAAERARMEAFDGVKYVARDVEMRALQRCSASQSLSADLYNLDQTDATSDGVYRHVATHGSETVVYVVDSGVDTTKADFSGRVAPGKCFVGCPTSGDGWLDDHGHGTHVAGTAVGTTYGVAKGATLVAVKVLDAKGDGAASATIQGLAWIINDWKANHAPKKAVINMSLGGPFNQASNDAAAAAFGEGIVVVVAAGNDGKDAKCTSPASTGVAITVGAVDKNGKQADFSNFGAFIDVWAPGVDIPSLNLGGVDPLKISGTSMASPYVAGVAAVMYSLYPAATPQQIWSRIQQHASQATLSVAQVPCTEPSGAVPPFPTSFPQPGGSECLRSSSTSASSSSSSL